MLYVYRPNSSTSARDLAEALGGQRLKTPQGLARLRAGDVLINWGGLRVTPMTGVKFLNNFDLRNKLTDATILKTAGVPTIETSQRPVEAPPDTLKPAFVAAQEFAEQFSDDAEPTPDRIVRLETLLSALKIELAKPKIPAGTWLPRLLNHVGGEDLIDPPDVGEYFVRKETLVHEYRVHSFLGRSIRGAKKVKRDDIPATQVHPWVRSFDAGWKMSYADGAVKQKHRDLAHKAVKALGLEFGAVDIGEKENGDLIVLEVNRAPGLSDGTVAVYQNAISRWVAGELAAA